jgi:hypothetical protein
MMKTTEICTLGKGREDGNVRSPVKAHDPKDLWCHFFACAVVMPEQAVAAQEDMPVIWIKHVSIKNSPCTETAHSVL